MKGFSLIEILIGISLITLVISSGLFITMDVYRSSVFNSDEELFVTLLTFARASALANKNEKAQGLHVNPESFILFSGNYVAENTQNISFARNPAFTQSGLNEVLFMSQTALPLHSGSITLTNGEKVFSISINSDGTLSW